MFRRDACPEKKLEPAELFENQWLHADCSWRDRCPDAVRAIHVNAAAPPWSNADGTLGLHPLGLEAPAGAWRGEWEIDMTAPCDGQGWRYSTAARPWGRGASSADARWAFALRRRRWTRAYDAMAPVALETIEGATHVPMSFVNSLMPAASVSSPAAQSHASISAAPSVMEQPVSSTTLSAQSTSARTAPCASLLSATRLLADIPSADASPVYTDAWDADAILAMLPRRRPDEVVQLHVLAADVRRATNVCGPLLREVVRQRDTKSGSASNASSDQTPRGPVAGALFTRVRAVIVDLLRCVDRSSAAAAVTAKGAPAIPTPSHFGAVVGRCSPGANLTNSVAAGSAFDSAAMSGAAKNVQPVANPRFAADAVAWASLRSECARLVRDADAVRRLLAAQSILYEKPQKHTRACAALDERTDQLNLSVDRTNAAVASLGAAVDAEHIPQSSVIEQRPQIQARLHAEVDWLVQEIAERNDAIDHIATEASDVADLFRDLASLVDEQDEGIRAIEENAGKARAYVADGVESIRDANRMQTDASCTTM